MARRSVKSKGVKRVQTSGPKEEASASPKPPAKRNRKAKPEPTATAQSILDADLVAIETKVKEGKRITAAERAMLQARSSNPGTSADVPPYVTSKTELARFLGITRQALYAWMSFPDAPATDAGGRYDVAAWIAYRDRKGLKGSESCGGAAKERNTDLRNEKLELEIEIMRGDYTANALIAEQLTSLASEQLSALRQKLEGELPAQLAKQSAAAIRKRMKPVVDDLCKRMQGLVERWSI